MMKRIIPYRRPFWTVGVWWPWKVLSRTTSRHHCSMTRSMEMRPIISKVVELWWNHMIRPDVVSNAAAAPKIGHGLGSTM